MKEQIKKRLPTKATRLVSQAIAPAREAGRLTRATQSLGVAMLHSGRCGSSVLGELLGQHPVIEWEGELFNRYRKKRLPWLLQALPPMQILRLRKAGAGAPLYGLETKHHRDYHLCPDILDMRLDEYFVRLQTMGFTHFVELRRENYLRRAVSARVASKRKAFGHHRPSDAPAASLLKVRLDPQRVRFGDGPHRSLWQQFEELDRLSEQTNRFLKDKPFLRLCFEDDIKDDPRVAYEKMCEFLGIEAVGVDITLQRTNPHALRDVLENWSEVASHLAGTSYEWMLEDE